MVGKTEPSTFAILCTALLNGTPQCRVWGSARARFGLHWMGANFKQPPVHRIFFDAYGKAWQRRSGGRKTSTSRLEAAEFTPERVELLIGIVQDRHVCIVSQLTNPDIGLLFLHRSPSPFFLLSKLQNVVLYSMSRSTHCHSGPLAFLCMLLAKMQM